MSQDEFAERVSGVGALAEPARRALYRFVVGQPEPVSRDQAAAGVDLPRHTVKFHLDRLVEAGLLETEFRRLSGRRGPGAGRPSKLYRRSSRQVTVSLPERRYDVAGAVLAEAVDTAARESVPVAEAVRAAARRAGRALAAAAEAAGVSASGPPAGPAAAGLDAVATVLAEQGYEPRRAGGVVRLGNCPFHRLAQQHTALVCGMNLDMIQALVESLDAPGVRAHLEPAADRCCVALRSETRPPHRPVRAGRLTDGDSSGA